MMSRPRSCGPLAEAAVECDVNGRCTDVGIEKERAGREKEVQVVLMSVASNLCRSLRMRAMAEGQDTAFLL